LRRSGSETGKRIGNLKRASEAHMIALNLDVDILPIPHKMFTGGGLNFPIEGSVTLVPQQSNTSEI